MANNTQIICAVCPKINETHNIADKYNGCHSAFLLNTMGFIYFGTPCTCNLATMVTLTDVTMLGIPTHISRLDKLTISFLETFHSQY